MTEKQLIGKVRKLRQIEPRKDWVILTKRRILGQEKSLSGLLSDSVNIFQKVFFQYKLALATLSAILILVGAFGFAQGSLPGDYLFPLKKIAEKTRAIFVSEADKPKAQLELANKRLEELTEIAETNQVTKLAPAIDEFQANVSEVAKRLVKIREPKNSQEANRAVVEEIKKLEKNKKKVESLGVVIGESEELDNAYKIYAEREIKNLENSSLTEKQEEILKEAKEYFGKGDYPTALIKTVEASQTR